MVSLIRGDVADVRARKSVWYRTQFHFGKYRCSTGGSYMQHVNGYAGDPRQLVVH
jgi:hypothetical protein